MSIGEIRETSDHVTKCLALPNTAKKQTFYFFQSFFFSVFFLSFLFLFLIPVLLKKMMPRDYEKNNSSSDHYAQNAEVKDDLVR